nr:MAG TPA: hypothetical protein [Caudoviricetes sp.]
MAYSMIWSKILAATIKTEMLLKYMVWCRKTHTLLGKTI